MFEFFDRPEVIKVIVSAGSMFLFSIGLFGLLSYKHIIKTFMSIAIMEISIFLLFIGLTFKRDAVAPIIDSTHMDVSIMNDPIPHAMILTAIVIGMAVLALGTSFAIEYYKLTGNINIDEMNSMRY